MASGVAIALIAAASSASAIVGPSRPATALADSTVMILERHGAVAGFCSGIVLSRRAVLTAAHCAPPGAELRIHFRNGSGQPVLLPVEDVLRHPGYRADAVRTRERSVDLAVVRLPADLPERFRPATLSPTLPAPVLQTPYRIVGFGVTREGDGRSSGELREAELVARAPLSSVLLWAKAAMKGGGACTGDSGGPILAAGGDEVVALTLWSAGAGKARCGDLTQALWLAPYRDWIEGAAKTQP